MPERTPAHLPALPVLGPAAAGEGAPATQSLWSVIRVRFYRTRRKTWRYCIAPQDRFLARYRINGVDEPLEGLPALDAAAEAWFFLRDVIPFYRAE